MTILRCSPCGALFDPILQEDGTIQLWCEACLDAALERDSIKREWARG